ncbi:MAG: hypothetical protein GXY06_04345 [Clostridiaceae bacterium]|nr:hypothetical protein [Clostridiaceae bacterium]
MSQDIQPSGSKQNVGESNSRGNQNRSGNRNYYKNNRRRRPSNNQYPRPQGTSEDHSPDKEAVHTDVQSNNRNDSPRPKNPNTNGNGAPYSQNNRNRRPNRPNQDINDNRQDRRPRDSQDTTIPPDSQRRDGARSRSNQDHRPKERRHDGYESRTRNKEFRPVETYEDVRKENERLEKEIWIEIAGIHLTKLD